MPKFLWKSHLFELLPFLAPIFFSQGLILWMAFQVNLSHLFAHFWIWDYRQMGIKSKLPRLTKLPLILSDNENKTYWLSRKALSGQHALFSIAGGWEDAHSVGKSSWGTAVPCLGKWLRSTRTTEEYQVKNNFVWISNRDEPISVHG